MTNNSMGWDDIKTATARSEPVPDRLSLNSHIFVRHRIEFFYTFTFVLQLLLCNWLTFQEVSSSNL